MTKEEQNDLIRKKHVAIVTNHIRDSKAMLKYYKSKGKSKQSVAFIAMD